MPALLNGAILACAVESKKKQSHARHRAARNLGQERLESAGAAGPTAAGAV
jgi:hypothetical protein